MSNSYHDTWKELKEGLSLFINIFVWSMLALAVCAGVGYVCLSLSF